MVVVVEMERTNQYFWSANDLIGAGSTADVYRAYRASDGETVAAKVFHPVNKSAWIGEKLESSFKELATMQCLTHPNVVKLLGVDVLHSNRFHDARRVLIMEFCSKGNLQGLLERPENCYGLSQSDFIDLFADLAEGMKYLRSQNVIHRDIKPSNIMVQMDQDGSKTYKLADFGAAKQLFYDYEEGFQSLVGTAEYLPPPMFEYWLSREQSPMFKSESELWTIGVTLFHAATCEIPFRPYAGVRKDYHTMLKIIKEKPVGCLCGIQRKENGPIEYSSRLPNTCLFSAAFRNVIEPLIARLLDAHLASSFPIEAYFAEAAEIMELHFVEVFNSATFSQDQVVLKPNSGNLVDEVSIGFRLDPSEMVLIGDDGVLGRSATESANKIESKVFLCSLRNDESCLAKPVIFDINPIRRNNNVRDAFFWAREVVGNMYYMLRLMERLTNLPNSLGFACLSLSLYVKEKLHLADKQLQSIKQQLIEIETDLKTIASTIESDAATGVRIIDDFNRIRTRFEELSSFASFCELSVARMESFGRIRQPNLRFFEPNEKVDLAKSLIENAEMLLEQFEVETKQQHFNAENTCAHMKRRVHLRALRQKMIDMLLGDVCSRVNQRHKEWNLWIRNSIQPFIQHQTIFSQYSTKLIEMEALVETRQKSKSLISECAVIAGHDRRGAGRRGNSENDISIAEQKVPANKLFKLLSELKRKQQVLDDTIARNDEVLKQIMMLLNVVGNDSSAMTVE